MPQHILIVGGGVGGTIVANLLARSLNHQEAEITQLVFNYEHPPRPPRPSLYYHMEKQLFNRAYWHIVPQGLV
jgi:2-polyprenyl-6-methoxyphenol hydroxylase-like FAD-dependent oxidoreductase